MLWILNWIIFLTGQLGICRTYGFIIYTEYLWVNSD